MNPGDEVVVEGLDRKMNPGTVVEILETTADEHEPEYLPVEGATLADYWRGLGVPPDDRVVVVDIFGGQYDYPESKVEVLEDD